MQKMSAGKFHCEPPFTSFDHLVGAQQDRCGHVDAHGPGRPEIDDRRELRRTLDWKVRWLRAFENLVDEDRGAPIHLWEVYPIGHQAACCREFRETAGWQVVPGRNSHEP